MRYRWLAAVSGLVVLGAVLTGCGRPSGVDGKLVDDWPAMPGAKAAVPADDVCYAQEDQATVFKVAEPGMPCYLSHKVEVIHVGTFQGADADRAVPPAVGGKERRAAYASCMAEAKTFLSGDWRTGPFRLVLGVPSETQWSGGARWFQCSILVASGSDALSRTGSVSGYLVGTSWAWTCFRGTITQDAITDWRQALCTDPHEAEFAGVYEAPDGTYPPDEKTRFALAEKGCKGVVAAFAGVPNDTNLEYRTRLAYDDFDADQWALGDRGVGCYIIPPKPVSRSLKGAGTGGLPIQRG